MTHNVRSFLGDFEHAHCGVALPSQEQSVSVLVEHRDELPSGLVHVVGVQRGTEIPHVPDARLSRAVLPETTGNQTRRVAKASQSETLHTVMRFNLLCE
jgi:hypothetical protein